MPAPEGATSSPVWIENRSTAGRVVLPSASELLRYRELAVVLALRDVQVRYKQTFFGVAWALLQPLLATAVLTLVFNRLAGLTSDGVPYAIFVLSGLVAWMYVSSSVAHASMSLVANEDIVTKVWFPRLLLPLAAVLPALADALVGLAALAVAMAVTGVAPGPEVVLLPLVLAALVLLAFGAGSLLAAINVRYRDVGYALPFALQIGLFLSPVAYSGALPEGTLAAVYHLNPMAGLIEAFRWAAIDAPAPPPEAWLSLVTGVVIVALGLLVFGRTERRFADII